MWTPRTPVALRARWRLRQCSLLLPLLFAGCSLQDHPKVSFVDTDVTSAESRYASCLEAAVDQRAANPASAEDIVAAAEGDCRPRYLEYADLVRAKSDAGAGTQPERQFAYDRADGYLRAKQADLRGTLQDRLALRALGGQPKNVGRTP